MGKKIKNTMTRAQTTLHTATRTTELQVRARSHYNALAAACAIFFFLELLFCHLHIERGLTWT